MGRRADVVSVCLQVKYTASVPRDHISGEKWTTWCS